MFIDHKKKKNYQINQRILSYKKKKFFFDRYVSTMTKVKKNIKI